MAKSNTPPSPYFIERTVASGKESAGARTGVPSNEGAQSLWAYWSVVKHHRWLIVSCGVVALLLTALYTFTRVPLYTATSTLLMDRKAPQILKLKDAQAEIADSNNTQYEILKSASFAERVIQANGLQSDLSFFGVNDRKRNHGFQPEAEPVANTLNDVKTRVGRLFGFDSQGEGSAMMSSAEVPGSIAPGVVDAYLSMLEVRAVPNTSLVQIKFTTQDPELSARLANAHVATYVRFSVQMRSQTNDEATLFLQEKLTELKARVEQSEAELNRYRKDKGIISVDEKSNIVLDRLAALNANLTAAEGERIGLEAQIRSIRGRNYDELPVVRNSGAVNTLKNDLNRSEAEYAALAKDFKPGYPPLDSLKARIEETRARLQYEVQKEVKATEAAYASATSRESQLRSVMEEQKKSSLNLKDSAVQYNILAREVDTNRQLYDGVLQRLKEIGIAADVRTSNIHIMEQAKTPRGPSNPVAHQALLQGLMMGIAGGMGLAFLLDYFDNSLKTPEEAQRFLQLPSLALVPDFVLLNQRNIGSLARLMNSAKSGLRSDGSKRISAAVDGLVLDHHPLSEAREAYRSLRTAMLLSQAGPARTILLTSVGRGDGKTTTTINSAIVFAQMGVPVLIIDADLRRPSCHTLLKVNSGLGLSEILAGQVDWRSTVKSTAAENLYFISSGAVPPNPAELLGSRSMFDLLRQLREHYEFIFVDSSPVMAVTDAVYLSAMVEGTLLVVGKKTPKPLLQKARERLSTPQSKILGVLMNRVDIRTSQYQEYYRQYHEYYGQESELTDKSAASSAESRDSVVIKKGETEGDVIELTAAQATSNQASEPILDFAVAKLADAIGPMAAILLREHVEALSKIDDELPQHKLDELISRLSGEIVDASTRSDFERAMARRIRSSEIQPSTISAVITDSPAEIVEPDSDASRASEVPAKVLELATSKLAEVVGPMAPLLVRDHMHEMGEAPETFPKGKFSELVTRLSWEIAGEPQRLRFQTEMEKQIQQGPYRA